MKLLLLIKSVAKVLVLALLGQCLTACAPERMPLTGEQRAAIYERANTMFTNAVLFKLLESGPTNTVGFKLAPLLLQEVASTNAPIAPQVVFFEEGKILLNGRPHDQVVYVWQPIGATGETVTQGIRITLNTSGSPVIWEVLVDNSGGDLIFVSQSLEAAAIKQNGQPLSGRRYAIESSLETAPNAIVARVIEDGPLPMGPIVHLNAGSHNVSTLVCRCMPTQAKSLLATQTYQLRPLAESKLRLSSEDAVKRLDRSLRLPSAL